MASKSINERTVKALTCPPDTDRVFLWDEKLAGFGVAAFPSGKKVYYAQFRLHGRSRRIKLGVHGTIKPKRAAQLARKVLGDVSGGKDPISERKKARQVRNFNEVADEFIDVHAKEKRKPRTASEYTALLRLYVRPAIGSRRLVDISPEDIARMHAKVSRQTPGAANRALSLTSTIWNWAARRGVVRREDNPARGIERNPEKGRERYLTSEELARLGDAVRLAETTGIPWQFEDGPTAKHVPKANQTTVIDRYAAAAIRLLIFTGARVSEILTARWDYVDFERALLLLPDSKTGAKAIYLPAPALAVLEALPRMAGNPYIVAGKGPRRKPSDAAKKPAEGHPRTDLKKPWAAIAKQAGLEGVRLHDLRHSFASVGAGASLGLPIIGKLLGHSQPATTQRYAHLDADPLHRAANLIGGHIAAAFDGRKAEIVPMSRAVRS